MPGGARMGEHDEHSLAGQVAIVTGASSGLGRATATALAQAGAHVALLARSAGDLEQVGAEVAATGQRAFALPTDLSQEDAIVTAVARTTDTFGRIDVLVNAAGTDVPGPLNGACKAPISNLSPFMPPTSAVRQF